MKFDTPAGPNPIDRQRVIGRPTDRIDGPLKTTGRAPYAYERWDAAADPLYGVVVGSTIAKGRIVRFDLADAQAAPGVRAIVTHENAGPIAKPEAITAKLLAGPDVQHYDQAVALVVADSFEQARAAAKLVRVEYARAAGRFSLEEESKRARPKGDTSGEGSSSPGIEQVGDFAGAFRDAPVKLDQTYTTPDQSHQMMEPHATMAAWDGDSVRLWTSNQMVAWAVRDLSEALLLPKEKIQVLSPYVGGGFGSKLWIRSDAVMAALGARATGRPVKVALSRPQVMNNTTHRPATIQRIRLGASRDGRITAVAHESWSGDLPGGGPETAPAQTKLLYAGVNRLYATRLAVLDLPEGNAMRAPGEAPGMMALEVAMDEMAEKLGIDPIEFRIRNDTQVDPGIAPGKPERPFSQRNLVECLRDGAQRFGWSRRNPTPGQVREGRWLVGMGTAAAFRNNITMKSAARVGLDAKGVITVASDMTDIGTGSYTIIAQTAAEMMGVPLDRVVVLLGDSSFPVAAGSGGQWGANSSTAGVYAACVKLREGIAQRLGFNASDAVFEDGYVRSGNRRRKLTDAGALSAEDAIEFGDLGKTHQQSTFGAHFCEAAVDSLTGEVRVRRLSGTYAAGRILNPKSARSQVIGAMVMGVGAALMEEAVVDTRFGYFVNHDLAEYHVPAHADIPHTEIHFLDDPDPMSSPMKAKGVGELGLCGVGAAIANAVYNACGVRVREYPITLDKVLAGMSRVA